MPASADAHAPRTLEQERLGDHADGEHALAAGHFGDHRRRTRARAAAHARGDEAHVDAFERALDLLDRFLGRGAADFGPRAGAEPLGDIGSQLDAVFGHRVVERLRVGIGDNEFDAFDFGLDHVGDGVAAGAADADHGNPRTQFLHRGRADIDAHVRILPGEECKRFILTLLPQSESPAQKVNALIHRRLRLGFSFA